MGHVAQFTKVNLNGNKFVLEVDLIHAGAQAQPGQFLGQCLRCTGAEIGKINFGCHCGYLLSEFAFSLLGIGRKVKKHGRI